MPVSKLLTYFKWSLTTPAKEQVKDFNAYTAERKIEVHENPVGLFGQHAWAEGYNLKIDLPAS